MAGTDPGRATQQRLRRRAHRRGGGEPGWQERGCDTAQAGGRREERAVLPAGEPAPVWSPLRWADVFLFPSFCTRTHTHAHRLTNTHAHSHTLAPTNTCTHTCIYTYSQTHSHTQTQACTHTHRHNTHTYTHTCTHTHSTLHLGSFRNSINDSDLECEFSLVYYELICPPITSGLCNPCVSTERVTFQTRGTAVRCHFPPDAGRPSLPGEPRVSDSPSLCRHETMSGWVTRHHSTEALFKHVRSYGN